VLVTVIHNFLKTKIVVLPVSLEEWCAFLSTHPPPHPAVQDEEVDGLICTPTSPEGVYLPLKSSSTTPAVLVTTPPFHHHILLYDKHTKRKRSQLDRLD
jgi:hypothetical protein